MGTLGALLRDNSLRAMVGKQLASGEITHLGLDTNYPTLNDMRKEIYWQDPANGEMTQDGTVTFVIDVDHPEMVEIYGFKFYPDSSTSSSSLGGGNFQEIETLAVGNEYTINVSGIQIDLPQ